VKPLCGVLREGSVPPPPRESQAGLCSHTEFNGSPGSRGGSVPPHGAPTQCPRPHRPPTVRSRWWSPCPTDPLAVGVPLSPRRGAPRPHPPGRGGRGAQPAPWAERSRGGVWGCHWGGRRGGPTPVLTSSTGWGRLAARSGGGQKAELTEGALTGSGAGGEGWQRPGQGPAGCLACQRADRRTDGPGGMRGGAWDAPQRADGTEGGATGCQRVGWITS